MRRLTLITILILAFCACDSANAEEADAARTVDPQLQEILQKTHEPIESSTENRIETHLNALFGNLERIGSAYNAEGGGGAVRAALSSVCDYASSRLTQLVNPAQNYLLDAVSSHKDGEESVSQPIFSRLAQDGGQNTLAYASSACYSLVNGSELSGGSSFNVQTIKQTALLAMAQAGMQELKKTNLPFISKLEATVGFDDGKPYVSALAIQPLWEDKKLGRFIFNQTSIVPHDGDLNFNTGFAVRQLFKNDTLLLGANIFFDRTLDQGHSRMSVGVDAETLNFGFSANRYLPLSDWKSLDTYYEERAMPGWDVRLDARLADYPSWNGFLRGYKWQAYGRENKSICGIETGLEWTPIPALTFTGAVNQEHGSSLDARIAMTFNYRFGDKLGNQDNAMRVNSRSVADRVYRRVERDNIVRVEKRRKLSTQLGVLETIGSNTVSDFEGTRRVTLGAPVLMPATITVANSLGAIVRLGFKDGAFLTIAQGSSISIDPSRVRLLSAGAIQYVSGSVTRTVTVPGGVITLLGTDIDVVSNGTTTTTRVRDGNIIIHGNIAGELSAGVGEMGEIVSGVVNGVAEGSPTYEAHEAAIVNKVSWVGSEIAGAKVAPYVTEAPSVAEERLSIGQVIKIRLHFNEAVQAQGGTPRLLITIGGQSRYADLVGGQSTTDLLFGYTIQNSDSGLNSFAVEDVELNGATISGNNKEAVIAIVPSTITLSGNIDDTAPPSGYATAFTTSPITQANDNAVGFQITNAEVGSTYTYTLHDSGSHTLTATGAVNASTVTVSGLNLTSFNDGTITLSVTLKDGLNNIGSIASTTTTKDTLAPAGYSTVFVSDPVTLGNQTAVAFNINNAEIGAAYAYTISDGASNTVTGSGMIGASTHPVSGVNVSTLNNGTLTLSVRLTDGVGNLGPAVTDTVLKDTNVPSGHTVAFTTDPVDSANVNAAAFRISNGEIGAAFSYTISDPASHAVTGTGNITSSNQLVNSLNLSTLNDGTVSLSVVLTDTNGNAAAAVTDTVLKDSTAPSGQSVVFTTDPINASNVTASSITISNGEVGAGFSYTISDAASHTVTGTGTIGSSSEVVNGLNLTSLNDGILTVSVVLTDTNGNAAAAVTDTVQKDSAAPSGQSVAFTTDPITNANKTAAAFTIANGEVGAGFSYTISDAASHTVTGTGTIGSSSEVVNGLNLTSLNDGILTVSVVLTDTNGNAAAAVTDTVQKDSAAPSGYTVAFTTDPVSQANVSAAAFDIISGESGAAFNYTITDGASNTVTGSGTIGTTPQHITGLNLSSLNNGTLTLSVILTDSDGNIGAAVTDTVLKDVTAPSGQSVAFTTDPITNANKTAAAFTIANGEVGAGFSYTISDAASHTVTGTGTIGSSSEAVNGLNLISLNDGTLTVSVVLTDTNGNAAAAVTDTVQKDSAAPSGQSVVFTTDPITNANKTAAAFTIANGEVGAGFSYTISDAASHTVTGTGTIASASDAVNNLNLSSLDDGTLTVSVVLTDTNGNAAAAVTDTVQKDSAAPSGQSVVFTTDPITNANKTAAAFTIANGEVGASYSYTVSDGASHTVTGTGTINSNSEAVTGLDLSSLNDGTLTVSVVLTDTNGNAAAAVTDTVVKDATVPSGHSVAFTSDPVTSANVTAGAFTISNAEVGTSYSYTISDAASHTVTGTGTIGSSSEAVNGLNLTSLNDGTLTISVVITDTSGNIASAVTDTVIKDVTAPSGQTVNFTTDPINAGNTNSAAFSIINGEVGVGFSYTISDAASHTVTGTGTIGSSNHAVSSLNLSGLDDGTLTISVVLTDTNGNAAAAVTDTVQKDSAAPSGQSVVFTTDPINASNVTSSSITISNGEVGAGFSYTISDAASHTVTGTGTIGSSSEVVNGLNLTSLNDGVLTVSVVLTDTNGNAAAAVTDSVTKDVSIPASYSAAFVTSPVLIANANSISFDLSSAEVGTNYSYSITDGASGSVTGTGSVNAATMNFTGVDVSALADGTLTLSFILTDTNGNAGSAATATVTKDTIAPYIVSVTPPSNGTYEP